jgi:hypothetical protein
MSDIASIKMSSDIVEPIAIDEIRKIKSVPHKFCLYIYENSQDEKITLRDAEVKSINIRKNLSFVLHIEKNKPLIYKIIKHMDSPMHLRFFSDTERSLKRLLNEISREIGKTEEDILYEVTTFQKGSGVIEGKRNIFDLSERHKSVVADKLKKILVDCRKKADQHQTVEWDGDETKSP